MSKNVNVGYVALQVDRESIDPILERIKKLPFDGDLIKPMDLHMTMMYDKRNPLSSVNAKWFGKPEKVYEATPTGVSLLGEEDSQYRAVVINFDSPDIAHRFDELSMVMNHNFDDHIQHVSVMYGATQRDLELIQMAIGDILPSVKIRLYGEYFSKVKRPGE